MGRPPEFKARVALLVLLEASERAAIHKRARKEGVSASQLVRGLVLDALGLPRPSRLRPS